MKHVSEPPPDDLRHVTDVAPEFIAIVYRALAKDPATRFASAADLEAELAMLPPFREGAARLRGRRRASRSPRLRLPRARARGVPTPAVTQASAMLDLAGMPTPVAPDDGRPGQRGPDAARRRRTARPSSSSSRATRRSASARGRPRAPRLPDARGQGRARGARAAPPGHRRPRSSWTCAARAWTASTSRASSRRSRDGRAARRPHVGAPRPQPLRVRDPVGRDGRHRQAAPVNEAVVGRIWHILTHHGFLPPAGNEPVLAAMKKTLPSAMTPPSTPGQSAQDRAAAAGRRAGARRRRARARRAPWRSNQIGNQPAAFAPRTSVAKESPT